MYVAELAERRVPCDVGTHAGRDEIIGARFDVEEQLSGDVVVEARGAAEIEAEVTPKS